MNILPKALSKLIESFERLPGIGPKSAQRLSFYLLHVPQEELDAFSDSVRNLKTHTVLCSVCKNVAEADPCKICADSNRDRSVLCIVEQPTDVLSIEKTGKFRGGYHVLHGAIDPLNNIGPDEIYLDELVKRVSGDQPRVREVILATNPNVEGEATAMYVAKQLRIKNSKLIISRLAHGLPMGADIEYADEVTLTRALEGRREF
jgi:recombination protein RecR